MARKKKSKSKSKSRKAKPRKKPIVVRKRKRTTAGGLALGHTMQAEKIKFKTPAGRGTLYQPILDRMTSLKKGQGFTVNIPSDTDARNFHNRLNAVLRRTDIKPPSGCKFEKRTTEDGKVGIKCVARKK